MVLRDQFAYCYCTRSGPHFSAIHNRQTAVVLMGGTQKMAAASVVQRHARVLVVDDDQTTSQTLGAILQNHGYEVDTAFCGKEAVMKAQRFNPDLLVSDVCMNTTNGIKAVNRIVTML